MRISARAGRASVVLFAPILLTLHACRNDHPEHPASLTHPDSGAPSVAHGSGTAASPHGVPGPGHSAPAWTDREVIGNVNQFLGTIEHKDRAAFMAMLSDRSLHQLNDFHATEEIWGIATDALGDIRHRQISVIGGTRDSVALMIRGERTVEGEETDDPIVMNLLRENGSWKVMYPGLLYPNNHLKR
jgi:hypothetical protein